MFGPPLCSTGPAEVPEALEVHIEESLFSVSGTWASAVDLAAESAQMSTALERFQKEQPLEFWLSDGPSRRHFSKLQSLAREIDAEKPLAVQLKESGLLRLFPLLSSAMQIPPDTCPSIYADYLSYMSSVNQLLHMAKQLREDVLGGKTHKYMAHQVALLYQCLNCIRSPFASSFKRRIEPHFNAMKEVTENVANPMLTPGLRQWLLALSADIQHQLPQCLPELSSKIEPFCYFYKKVGQIARP